MGKQAACLCTVGDRNPDPKISELELEFKELGNSIGMGAMGFVGISMVIDTHIEVGYCHVYMKVLEEGADLPLELPQVSATNFHCSPAAASLDNPNSNKVEVENFGPFFVECDIKGNSLFERENKIISAGLDKVYEGTRPAVLKRFGETDDRSDELI